MTDATPLSASKKCPHCGFWSPWQQQSDDACQRCGQLLDPVRNRSEQAREKEAQAPLPQFLLIELKPEDGPITRFFKHIARGGQLAFAATVSFILWVITLLVG
ncbi:hypothetical protein [Hymenobacter elongatus]|uniref:Uncharacterized protein n=1 Tax=Hymenobacter elongatus TaxID=877208 RepID=A0A4Z0PLY6_9BACT|nr:hypothetical protein [Hymenobacter elongatus]TGE16418.1 hypothetical protein E5J99_09845 [Hymenobacter elongatus]